MNEVYLYSCPKCREPTKQRIQRFSRTRGVKLICLKCGHGRRNYVKFDKLIIWEESNGHL